MFTNTKVKHALLAKKKKKYRIKGEKKAKNENKKAFI